MKSTTRGTLAGVMTAAAAVAGAAAATPAVAADHDVAVTIPALGNESLDVATPLASVGMPVVEQDVSDVAGKDLRPAVPKAAHTFVGVVPPILVPQTGKATIESETVTAEPGRVGLDLPRV